MTTFLQLLAADVAALAITTDRQPGPFQYHPHGGHPGADPYACWELPPATPETQHGDRVCFAFEYDDAGQPGDTVTVWCQPENTDGTISAGPVVRTDVATDSTAILAAVAEVLDEYADLGPTYHGILSARCHACGYTSTRRSELETWNDGTSAGECMHCATREAAVTWHMADGTVTTTHGDDSHDLQDWSGMVAQRVHRCVVGCSTARPTADTAPCVRDGEHHLTQRHTRAECPTTTTEGA